MLSSCANIPTGKYREFSSASQTIETSSDQLFSRIEVQQRYFSIFAAPDAALTPDTFKPQIMLPNGSIKSYDISPQLDARKAALEILANYAKALDALAEKDYTKGVDDAAQNLATSLDGLPGGAQSTIIINAMSSVVDVMGHAATDRLKRNHLLEAMKRAHSGIVTLAELTQKDTQQIQRFIFQMRDSYIRHAQDARPTYGTWARYKFDEEVAQSLEDFQAKADSLQSMDIAMLGMPRAHQQLMDSLRLNEHGTELLKDFVESAKNAQSFSRKLKK